MSDIGDGILQQILDQVTLTREQGIEHGRLLSSLDTSMKSLIGNGSPGRIDKIEADVDELKSAKNKMLGVNGAVVAAIGSWEWVKWKFHL
jgi:hypothetical protein